MRHGGAQLRSRSIAGGPAAGLPLRAAKRRHSHSRWRDGSYRDARSFGRAEQRACSTAPYQLHAGPLLRGERSRRARLAHAPRLAPSTEGQLLVGLRAASDRLLAGTEPLAPSVIREVPRSDIPPDNPIHAAGKKLLAALNERGAPYRIWMPRDRDWIVDPSAATEDQSAWFGRS